MYRPAVTVDRTEARARAAKAVADGRPLEWFEDLYAAASAGGAVVPWADQRPNPHLVSWPLLGRRPAATALVVGCGIGDDAEWLAGRGLQVTAFDIAPSAIAACRRRFPHTSVKYVTANLLALPPDWVAARFDLVVEAYTIQVLPPQRAERAAAFEALASVTGGSLLVIARGRKEGDDPGSMPWPLAARELRQFEAAGLTTVCVEEYPDEEEPDVLRIRATFDA